MSLFTEEQWVDWIDRLSLQDYVVIDDFLSDKEFQQLLSLFHHLQQEDEFARAGIGSSLHHTLDKSVRGDQVYWLDKPRDENSIASFYALVDEFKDKLNRYCYLGIKDYEFHLAYYPEGTFYKRHLDQFKERNNRLITLIIYLNKDWQPGDGGELNIYTANGTETVAPLGKRLVIFKSDVLEHEVLPTIKGRYSITGWYLKKPVGLGFL